MALPALVYSTGTTPRQDLDDYLLAEGLYRHDDLPELPEDQTKPVLDRPTLRRLISMTNRSGHVDDTESTTSLDYEPIPNILVVDKLSSLGPDLDTQIAVVGAFMGTDTRVVINYEEVPQSWYQSRAAHLAQEALDLQDAFIQNPDYQWAERMWRPRNDWQGWFIATTHSPMRNYEAAKERAHQLITLEGHTQTFAAQQLQVDGYRNRESRVRWYAKNVRAILRELP